MWTAPQIVLVITQNSLGVQYCKHGEGVRLHHLRI